MKKFCFIGDLHFEALDKYFKKETNPNKYIFEQLTKIINYCRKAEIKNIFQLGDVFDHPHPDQKSIKDFIQFLHNHSDLNFHIIAGNHDYSNIKTTSLEIGTFLSEEKILPNVNIYTKPHHSIIEGVNVFFAPYLSHQKFDYLSNTQCICLGHFEVKGAKHDSGQLIKNGVAKEELDSKDFWVLGHLHRHQNLDPKVYYVGTALQYNFGEPLPKGFVISNISEINNIIEVQHNYIELDTPYCLENININKQDDFNNLHYNNEKYFYKLFINSASIIIPQNILNGSVSNIYKIIRSYNNEENPNSISSDLNNNNQLSLSEAFSEDYAKEKLFEPLGGLEDYLATNNFSEDEIQQTKFIVDNLKLEFNPKR